jgi:uncharacterized protein YqgV (UPF0045/DUF77 family)
MEASVDISLYPLADEHIPAINEFIERVQQYPAIAVVRNDFSTQLLGDYEQIMELLKIEIRLSWEQYEKSILVVKFLGGDLRGLSSD